MGTFPTAEDAVRHAIKQAKVMACTKSSTPPSPRAESTRYVRDHLDGARSDPKKLVIPGGV
jgi:hypothetical protein